MPVSADPRPVSLPDRIANALRAGIESGELTPGAKLPVEATLVAQYAVSRTVIREAIARLKNEGLLEGRRGSGVYVTQASVARSLRVDAQEAATLESVLHILTLRRALESECASLAARHRSNADMHAIDAALALIAADVEAGRVGVEADLAFHRAVAVAAGNPYILKTLAFFAQYLQASVQSTRSNEARQEATRRQVLTEHEAIAAAIRERDPVAAEHAAQTHLFNAARRLRASRS